MPGKESHDSPEKEGLSARMRELISIATVDERRKPSRKQPEPGGAQRRRTDLTTEQEEKAS